MATKCALLYGVSGYTGPLIAQKMAAQGIPVMLAGRSAQSVAAVATHLNLPYCVFDLHNEAALATALQSAAVFINAAGPFAQPPQILVQACIQAQVHYLDLAGEYTFFDWLAQFDTAAQTAGVMLMPGVGFVIAATDCMAAHLAQQLPTATHLALAYRVDGAPSRGTALGALQHLGQWGALRRAGALVPARLAEADCAIHHADFGVGNQSLAYNAWSGDLVAAYRHTGIANIESYLAFPSPPLLRLLDRVGHGSALQWLLNVIIRQVLPAGPSAAQRQTGQAAVWGKAWVNGGPAVSACWATAEAYEFTAVIAAIIAQRVITGDVRAGFQSPASAYGAGLIKPVLHSP
ncbi:MAG: saccharopine dehydrogenase NADP-binding domain-containing protein [Anaerolineae bacterium]|nr:saccharopine dehydrogenase NADP-binding domain-containing protein [Anaerolineae bacterium]